MNGLEGMPLALLEPTNLLLLACALIYGLIGQPGDGVVLLLFVLAIVLLDGVQRHRSQRALAELERLSAPRARVVRNGVELDLEADQVRIGDQLRLEEGDRVAADARLEQALGLWLDESMLTGESLPVLRQSPGESVLAGSLVVGGRGIARVTAVADSSELGRLARNLVMVEAPPTRLQRRTRRLTTRLTLVALAICAGLTLLQGAVLGDWPRALLAGLALALAVLPNEIPVVLALFLALGALRLGRRGVLARWPAAVESLGSATVLAVDKTGTLTDNRMAVQQLLTWPELDSWSPADPLSEPWHALVEMAVLASRGDPVDAMEQAIQRLAADHLKGSEHLHPDWPLQRDYPLQSHRLAVSRLWHDGEGRGHLAAKGAPEAIADLCHLPPCERGRLQRAADQLAAKGMRVLAVARGLDGLPRHPHPEASALWPDDPHAFLFEPLGFIGLADPLRSDVAEAIAIAQQAGVRVVMITGDGPVTARAIADQAGLPPGPVLCGDDLVSRSGDSGSSAKEGGLLRLVKEVSVFARVLPQQKLDLVRALQASGAVVAMTGDGVNDAAALKAADIGVAMGRRGTAVARESADLVLLNDRFSDLVAALALGRRLDANLQRALAYTLAIHLPIALLALLPLLLPAFGPILLPVHIALLHLVIDPACTVVFEALEGDPDQMRRPPRAPDGPLFAPLALRQAVLQGVVLAGAGLMLACWPLGDLQTRRNLVMSMLVLAGGALVWLNGAGHRIAGAGPVLGGTLLLLLQLVAPLRRALALAPLSAANLLLLTLVTAVALLLTACSRP
jgi:Ca2+-transporting ATPase